MPREINYMETQLFTIKLNEQGKRLLKKLQRWLSFMLAISILICLVDFYWAYKLIKTYFLKLSNTSGNTVSTLLLTYILYIILYGLMVLLQSIFFIRFSSQASRAIKAEDEYGFNQSFRWMIYNVITLSIFFLSNFAWTAYFLFFRGEVM